MAFHLLPAVVVTAILVLVTILIMRLRTSFIPQASKKLNHSDNTRSSTEFSIISKNLESALSEILIFPHDGTVFDETMNSYWAKQECEVVPACVIRPHNIQQLSTAITILKQEYERREKQGGDENSVGSFAVRSGGHSPVPGAASIKGGILIDLNLFHEVIPSENGTSVVVGAGAKWKNVFKVLDEKNLAIVGGRNSDVGVGGLTLGGGLSFFSPRFGLVCSNILSYEVVLASGSIVTASASKNADLWKALKGGSNNFGIITQFTARSFPSSRIWSGFLYLPSFQASKVLEAFHEFVSRADSSDPNTSYDQYAAGPITSFSYIQALRAQMICVNLVYTKLPEKKKGWPICWQTSLFASMWRLWSTCKVQTLTNATDELSALNPPGRRQVFGTVTIKNDANTLTAVHATYRESFASIRSHNIKGLVFTLVLQPLLPSWTRKGDPNPMGLNDSTNKPLVIVSFTVNWDESHDDALVKNTTRRAIEQIEAVAAANKTAHPYRYLNYCQEWQKPFEGYGEGNLRFLRGVSRRYDPDGMFQRGCVGGFKLGMKVDEG